MKIEVRAYTNEGENVKSIGSFSIDEIPALMELLRSLPVEDADGNVEVLNEVRFDVGLHPHIAAFYKPKAV